MKCKSCSLPLESSHNFCSNCGGKIVEKRLSLKGTWSEFIGPFFSWDSNFFKTTRHLFTEPETVLTAYINGARKSYFQPFSYLIVFSTIALLFYKFFPIEYGPGFTEGVISGAQSSSGELNEVQMEQLKNLPDINKIIFEYYNFVVLFSLPAYAFTAYVVFYKKKHNFSEHLVFQTYIQSIIGYMTIVLQILFVSLFGINGDNFLFGIQILSIIYANYVFIRMYKLNLKSILISNLLFASIFTGIILVIMIILTIAILVSML